MAKTRVKPVPREVVARNLSLVERLLAYLIAHPRVLSALPDGFELVILPDDDPEMRLYNLELLDTYGSEGRPVVFVRLNSGRVKNISRTPLNVYVPLAV